MSKALVWRDPWFALDKLGSERQFLSTVQEKRASAWQDREEASSWDKDINKIQNEDKKKRRKGKNKSQGPLPLSFWARRMRSVGVRVVSDNLICRWLLAETGQRQPSLTRGLMGRWLHRCPIEGQLPWKWWMTCGLAFCPRSHKTMLRKQGETSQSWAFHKVWKLFVDS